MTAFDLRIGDALALLKDLPTASFDSIVTDPPYELGFMGKGWDSSGIAFHVELWAEALRVIKPGGHLLAFSGTRTYHRMVVAIEDAGWEVRDQLAWTYGSGMPKARDVGDGRRTTLKPALEPIVLCRAPFVGSVYDAVAANGLGALNIDACRIPVDGADAAVYAANCSGDRGHAGTRAADGTRSTDLRTGGGSAHAGGRYPANLLHDGSDEVLACFPQSPGAKASVSGDEPSPASRGDITNARVRVPFESYEDGAGSAARFFYCGKATPAERDAGLDHLPPVNGRRNYHATVKPIAVGRWLQRLVTPAGGATLDLFAGSGTFGVSAILEGLVPTLLELDRDDDGKPAGFEAIIRGRLAWAIEERAREAVIKREALRVAAFRSAQLALVI